MKEVHGMNWYLFALFCEGLVALLIALCMFLYAAVQFAIAKNKAELTVGAVKEICEETVGRSMQTMEDVTKELIDYSMQKTQEAVKSTFKMEDES